MKRGRPLLRTGIRKPFDSRMSAMQYPVCQTDEVSMDVISLCVQQIEMCMVLGRGEMYGTRKRRGAVRVDTK